MFRNFTTLFVFLTLFSFVGRAFAYDPNTTHAALTDEIVDFYNLLHPESKITIEEKEWIIQGSIDEDEAVRPINHFYDPIRKIGWNGENLGNLSADVVKSLTSSFVNPAPPADAIRWVNDRILQSRYNSYGGDRTWKQALEYFANGNKKEAYITLGHSLHLLEDMSVPDHTRNDPHPPAGGEFDSPYENYASKWNRANIQNLDILGRLQRNGAKPPILNSVEEYLDGLARYSNKYFFSRDTIYDTHYVSPKIFSEDNYFGYGLDENEEAFPLVKIKEFKEGLKYRNIFLIEASDKFVLDAYFSRLAPKAVLYGAGVIDFFNKQAKDAIIAKDFPTQIVRLDSSNPFVKFFTSSFSPVGEIIRIKNNIDSVLGNVADSVLGLFIDSSGDSGVVDVRVDMGTEAETVVQTQNETGSLIQPTQQNNSAASPDARQELINTESIVSPEISISSESVSTPTEPQPIIIHGGGGVFAKPITSVVETVITSTEVATSTATSTTTASASTTPDILISEIMYDLSGADTDREWIEIYNNGTSTVIISESAFKFFEGGTNHSLSLVQGTSTILAGGYAVIADDTTTFLGEYPAFSGTVFDSSFSLLNSGEILSLKNDGVVINEIDYSIITGANGDGNSLQLINNTWTAATPTPGAENVIPQTNLSPLPNFGYSPSEPSVGDTITFDASSSTDPDGQIFSYSWDFGDSANASTSVPTTNHAYATSGAYLVQLTVFDDGGVSGIASTTITIPMASTPTSTIKQQLDDSAESNADQSTYWYMNLGTGFTPGNYKFYFKAKYLSPVTAKNPQVVLVIDGNVSMTLNPQNIELDVFKEYMVDFGQLGLGESTNIRICLNNESFWDNPLVSFKGSTNENSFTDGEFQRGTQTACQGGNGGNSTAGIKDMWFKFGDL